MLDVWTLRSVATFIFTSLMVMIVILCFVAIPDKNHDIVVALATAITTSAISIVAYFFGSSASSKTKDDTIKAVLEKAP